MKENEILSEIHRVREEIARECGYDVKELFRRMRVQTEQLKAEQAALDSLKPGEDLVALQHAFDAADEAKQEESK